METVEKTSRSKKSPRKFNSRKTRSKRTSMEEGSKIMFLERNVAVSQKRVAQEKTPFQNLVCRIHRWKVTHLKKRTLEFSYSFANKIEKQNKKNEKQSFESENPLKKHDVLINFINKNVGKSIRVWKKRSPKKKIIT